MMMKFTVLAAILLTSFIACQTTPSGQESQIPDDERPIEAEEAVEKEPEKQWWEPGVADEEPAVEVEEEMDADRLASLIDNPDIIELGEELYGPRCGACHGMSGEGGIGPGFDDGQWAHGADPIEIYAATWEGIPVNGMPAHKHLSPTEVAAIVAYMLHEFDPTYP